MKEKKKKENTNSYNHYRITEAQWYYKSTKVTEQNYDGRNERTTTREQK